MRYGESLWLKKRSYATKWENAEKIDWNVIHILNQKGKQTKIELKIITTTWFDHSDWNLILQCFKGYEEGDEVSFWFFRSQPTCMATVCQMHVGHKKPYSTQGYVEWVEN